MSSNPSGALGADGNDEDVGRRMNSSKLMMRNSRETKPVTLKQRSSPLGNASKSQQGNMLQQQQQHLLLLNRQECSSNQSGSDSGLCYTNSISSENSSLIVNTTSLEQINAHGNDSNNDNNGTNKRKISAIKFVSSNDGGREKPIMERDSFNNETQDSIGSNNESANSCIENGKTDAAATNSNIPNKAVSDSVVGNNMRIEAKQSSKSVRVPEINNNNNICVNKNQGNSLSPSLLISPRTKDELGGQLAHGDTNESSPGDSVWMISNTDDEAKIKHSTRRRANQSAISTSKPSKVADGELDRAGNVLAGHEMQGTSVSARFSPVQQSPFAPMNQIVSSGSEANPQQLVKSSLKKAGDRFALNKPRHNRNVSFNQTVIVFCEEIETSSTSETFEPPLDYQDTSPVDEPHELSSSAQKGNVVAKCDKATSNVYVNDDFEILSKIVGDDASSLTDDQLFGLLESGSLLRNFDLGEDEQTSTMDRLNSNQSYLCHNAISDSDSESSLIVDTLPKEVSVVSINKPATPSSKLLELKKSQPSAEKTGCQPAKNDRERSSDQRSCSQSTDTRQVSDAEPIITAQQRLMPARVKVSTVDNNFKRHHHQKTNTHLDEITDSSSQTRNSCPRTIQNQRQGTASAKQQEPMLLRLVNAEQAILSKAQIKTDSISTELDSKLLKQARDGDYVLSQNTTAKTNTASSSLIKSDNQQISMRDCKLADQQQQHKQQQYCNPAAQNASQQASNVANAQIIQTSQACHICRAIESNLHQNEFGPRSERTSLLANNGPTTALHPNAPPHDHSQVQRTMLLNNQNQHGGTSASVEHQKQSQLVPSSQSSCVSCRESAFVRQQQPQQKCVTQPTKSDHQQARPITCQLVYVVDQCGNRMKALQVVGPAQQAGIQNNQIRPVMVASENFRLPAPPSGQNWIRISNPSGQVLGVIRNASVQLTNTMNSPQVTNQCASNEQMPSGEVTIAGSAPQQQRMHVVSQSAPRNHTVYYVRQPLVSQDFRHSAAPMAGSVARSFPDVHEIRRLDGIRAPTESPGLAHNINHANISPKQAENKSVLPESNMIDRRQKVRRDDSDDPTFGFSRRPAVKVVANAVRESQVPLGSKSITNYTQATFNSNGHQHHHQQMLAGSVTLDRKNLGRDHLASQAREHQENIPSTSSMSNINKTLTSYVGQHSNQRCEKFSKHKVIQRSQKQTKRTLNSWVRSNMMSFLDLSTASEEERRLINEILSDTSVVNFAEPLKQQFHQQQLQPTKLLLQNSKIQSPQQQTTKPLLQQQPSIRTNNTSNSNNRPQNRHQHHPNQNHQHHDHQNHYHHQHQTHHNVNNVMGIDVAPTQPAGYAIPPIPPQTHGFGPPPPPPHHVYGGPPIFQPYTTHYFIPYNLPPYALPPLVLPPNNPVAPASRQQQSEEIVKLSPNESTDVQQIGLNVSKQLHESSINSTSSEKLKSSAPGECNDSGTEQSTQESTDSVDRDEKSQKQNQDIELSPSVTLLANSLPECNDSGTEQSTQESAESTDRDEKSQQNQENNSRATAGQWSSAASKSWASLFKGDASAHHGSSLNGDNETNNIVDSDISDGDDLRNNQKINSRLENNLKNSNASTEEQRSQDAARRALDKLAPKLAQKINSITLKHSLPLLRPRGFINKGNGCYINSTLQALIACPPFYNLMKEIGDLKGIKRENSCTPILNSFVELFQNFPPLDANKKNKQVTSVDQKLQMNYLQAEAIEPRCIYNVLGQIKSECLKGAQEDAEEFLSSVLNGLHEEMIGLSETLLYVQENSNNQNGHLSDAEEINGDSNNDENLWREVGPKNRSLPIRTATVINTPIQEIFGGSLFSIRTAGKDRCGHRSPFFDLQLDISSDNVKSLQDAIKSFTATEIIQDFYCSKTKQKLDAQRRTSLDQLPPILILHLKQFIYTQDHGLKKLMKRIEYPIDFELPDSCLHDKNPDKSLRNSRTYKLLAVVYHEGKEAVKGHYLTDVYHIGSSQWIRCDDSNLKVVPAPRIENPDSSRTPYLLFYRRLNTLGPRQSNSHENKKKN